MRRLRAGLLLCAVSTVLPVEGADPIPEVARLLTEVIRIDTSNPPGNEGKLAEFLKSKFAPPGFEIDIVPTPRPGKAHFHRPPAQRRKQEANTDRNKYGVMNGIIGFELEMELLEGKFKLGQDRSPADKQSLLKKLTEAKAPRSLRDFTASFYDRQGKA